MRAHSKTLLPHRYENLLEFDQAQYRFRGETDKPYRGALFLDKKQVIVDGCLVPATLSMAAGYIYCRLCEASRALLAILIPHRYVLGSRHGRIEGNGWHWDMRLDAGEKNVLLETLQRRVWAYEQERLDALLTQWDADSRSCVYLVDAFHAPATHHHFAFSNKSALQAVRFNSFASDCRAISCPPEELEEAVSEEKALLTRFIEAQHADVLRNPNRNVIQFRERPRVRI